MYGLLLCALLAAPNASNDPDRDASKGVSLDGNWTILCFEKDGQPVPDAKKMTVKINNNTVTCHCPTKNETKMMRLEFGPHATIRVTETGEHRDSDKPKTGEHRDSDKPKTGVCVLTNDFVAISLNQDTGNKVDGERTSLKVDGSFTEKPQMKSQCTLILKRSGSQ